MIDENYKPSRDIALRALSKFIRAADELSAGKNVQVTRLMPLFRLCRTRKNFARFAAFLVKKDFDTVGLTHHSPVTDISNKLRLLSDTLMLLESEGKGIRSDATALNEELYDLQPGGKRINIHTCFRRASDRELLVAEKASIPLINEGTYLVDYGWWAYYLASTYVSTLDVRYNSYRTILKPESAPRILDIVEYWSAELLDISLAECIAQTSR